MTDKLAIWLSGGSLLVSLASFGLAAMAKRQAQKTATLGLRTEAINHVREALHDLIVDKVVRAETPINNLDDLLAVGAGGTVKAKTVDSIRKALNLSHLVFSSRVRKELDRAYAAAYRLQEIRQLSDQDARDILALRENLQTLLAHMNQEATLIGWSAPWRWLRTTGCLAVAGLLLVLTTGGAGAQQQRDTDNANFMLPHCKRFLVVEPGKATFTEGLCAGTITSLAFVGQILSSTRRFCFPQNVTNEQMIRVVVAYIEARPARMHEDFRVLALEALREAWPCS